MSNILEIGGESKFKEICDNNAGKLIILDFTATWCPPCRKLGPELREIAGELADKVVLVIADVDQNSEFSTAHGVNGIPNILMFKNGEKVDEFVGYKQKDVVMAMINKHV